MYDKSSRRISCNYALLFDQNQMILNFRFLRAILLVFKIKYFFKVRPGSALTIHSSKMLSLMQCLMQLEHKLWAINAFS